MFGKNRKNPFMAFTVDKCFLVVNQKILLETFDQYSLFYEILFLMQF